MCSALGPSEYPLNGYVSGCIQCQAFVAFKHSQTQGHTKRPKISGGPDYIGGIGPWHCFAHSWNISNGLWQTEWCGIKGNPWEIPGRSSPAETQLQTHPVRELETHEARHHVSSCCGTSKPSFFKGFVMARLPPLDQISLTANSWRPRCHKHQGLAEPLCLHSPCICDFGQHDISVFFQG